MAGYSKEFGEFLKELCEREGCTKVAALRDILTDCLHFSFVEDIPLDDVMEGALLVFEEEVNLESGVSIPSKKNISLKN